MNNNDNGYVYILMNPSMSGLVKIGKTQREPEERAKELSSTTGVPTPFTVVYDSYFENCSEAEKHIHTLLENKGYRVSQYREFFEIPIKDAIDAVMETRKFLGTFEEEDTEDNIEDEDEDEYLEPWSDILEIAEGYHYGVGDYLQDFNEAIIYYQKVIKLGYKPGYHDIGHIYTHDLNDEKKGFEYYKKGIDDGCSICYAALGFYYLNKDINNAEKSFELYMKYTPEEELIDIYVLYYLMFSLKAIEIDKRKNEIEYLSKTLPYKKKILQDYHLISTITYTYKSFYNLPETAQSALVTYCEERSYTDYMFSSYRAELELGSDFQNYLELIYETGYISPDDFDGEILKVEYMEIDRIE
jgi:hypothetical protein